MRETANRQTAAAMERTAGPPRYDYTKSFAQQIEDYKNGLFPKNDTFIVGGTPDVLRRVGLSALPMTISQRHVDYAIKGTKNADHTIGETNGNIGVFYWDKNRAMTLLQRAGLQLPGGLPQDGSIHSVRDMGANINPKFEDVTQMQQFKRWFGDWEIIRNTQARL